MKFKIVIFLWVLFNLFTLIISPIPWNDEIYFADLSLSLSQNKGFVNTILPMENPPFVYIYGPIYFFIQAALIKLFGLNIFLFRLVNFISSVGILWILNRYFKVNKLLIFLLATSPLFIQNAHSGRMDLLATFFALMGYVPFAGNIRVTLTKIGIASFFFLLAFLTSPRVAFLFPGLYVLLLADFKLNFKYLCLALIPVVTVILGLISWSLFTTGNLFGAYLPIFQSNIAQSSDLHIGVSLIRGHIDDLISIFFVFFGIVFYIKNRNLSILSMLINFTFFSIFVKEIGPYGAMVLPFLVIGLTQINFKNNFFRYSIISSAAIFLIIFLGKGVFLVASLPVRNYTLVDNFIKTRIPIGEKVIATNEYYYGLLKNNNLPMMVQFESNESISYLLKESPRYILINKQYYNSRKLDFIFQKIKYKNIGEINEGNIFEHIPYYHSILSRLSFNEGMNGFLLEKEK
jgi:hypothetical protein